jgi:hypothetical protein
VPQSQSKLDFIALMLFSSLFNRSHFWRAFGRGG